MAPEYAMNGYLTDKADVYSFGIVALEIVSGRKNISSIPKEGFFNLLDRARALNEGGNLMDLIDPRLGTEFKLDEVVTMINVALHCTNVSYTARPSMSTVVSLLEGREKVGAFISDVSVSRASSKGKVEYNENSLVSSSSNSQMQSTIDLHWTESFGVSSDLYPVVSQSDYLEGRSWKRPDIFC